MRKASFGWVHHCITWIGCSWMLFVSSVCITADSCCCRYAHVDPSCLETSPTSRWHQRYEAAGGRHEDLVAHVEERADYDGLAVRWGINHKTDSVEECADACRNHKPNPQGTGLFDKLPCNVFVWCGGAQECFEPDAHHHVRGWSCAFLSSVTCVCASSFNASVHLKGTSGLLLHWTTFSHGT